MDFNKIFQSKKFKVICAGILGIVVLLLVFGLGMFVGFKKANFSYKWGENYHRNFAGPRGGFMNDFKGREFTSAHGVFGQIIKIDPATETVPVTTVAMKGQDGVEKIILINDKTVINSLREKIQASDLKVDDQIVVIGEPNEAGQIEAKLIRLMPVVPSGSTFPTHPLLSPVPAH